MQGEIKKEEKIKEKGEKEEKIGGKKKRIKNEDKTGKSR